MSEIRINIIDRNLTISGNLHGSFGDILVASLAAEPETVKELEVAVERFIPRDSDWTVFWLFRETEDFEPWDAGLLVIDLVGKVIMSESTYSSYSSGGTVRLKTEAAEDFWMRYRLSDYWKCVGSLPEFYYAQDKGRERVLQNQPIDMRAVLFGTPLFEFLVTEYLENKDSTAEDLFTSIHAKWLMTAREDLRGKTPREVMFEQRDFIEADLESRSLQWSFTKHEPPPLSRDSNAYKFAGFGTHEIVVHYYFFRHLLEECFSDDITESDILERIAHDWLNQPQNDFSGRAPASIIDSERRRINLTISAQECVIDDDCEVCRMMAVDFIDTPMFWHLDGSNMEYDRFEFSFCKTIEEWEAEQREYEEMAKAISAKTWPDGDDFFDYEGGLIR